MPTNDRLTRRFFHKLLLKRPTLNLKDPQIIWWSISGSFVLAVVCFFTSPLMRISTISCLIDNQPNCPDYIVPAFSKLQGQLIYLADLEAIVRQIQAVKPEARRISVSRQWPNTLILKIDSQYNIANLQIPASSSALLVGDTKYITGVLDQPNPSLPTIIASSAAQLTQGEKISDDAVVAAVDIASLLPNLDTLVVNSPLDIRVVGQDGKRYLFTSNKSIASQLAALQVILATTTINVTDPIYDLRYDHPVLKQTW